MVVELCGSSLLSCTADKGIKVSALRQPSFLRYIKEPEGSVFLRERRTRGMRSKL